MGTVHRKLPDGSPPPRPDSGRPTRTGWPATRALGSFPHDFLTRRCAVTSTASRTGLSVQSPLQPLFPVRFALVCSPFAECAAPASANSPPFRSRNLCSGSTPMAHGVQRPSGRHRFVSTPPSPCAIAVTPPSPEVSGPDSPTGRASHPCQPHR